MKKTFATVVLALVSVVGVNADTLLSFDFSGSTNTAASNTQNSTFDAVGVVSSTMSRGAGIAANNAANSFRGTGFSNNGISVSNTDYFEFSVVAETGYVFSVDSIYGNFNGTASFSAAAGVTMAYAYSLDGGATFNLMDTFVRVGTGNYTYSIGASYASDLTDVTSVVFRLYASGQTTTGGWGLQSASTPGTIGLSVDGVISSVSAVPEPSSFAVVAGGMALAGVALRRRRR